MHPREAINTNSPHPPTNKMYQSPYHHNHSDSHQFPQPEAKKIQIAHSPIFWENKYKSLEKVKIQNKKV